MRAIIRNIEKAHLPHNVDPDGNHRLHILTEVDFVDGSGGLVLNQSYAHLPEHFDGCYFQKQADAMQSDLEYLRERADLLAAIQVEDKPADDAIRKFKLEFGDAIQLRDEVKDAG